MLTYLYALIILVSVGIIVYIYYTSAKAKTSEDDMVLQERKQREEEELARIAQERKEKQKRELERKEQDVQRNQRLNELKPIIEEFLTKEDTSILSTYPEVIKSLLMDKHMRLQDFLLHNVNRRFSDGKPYRVGMVYKTEQGELSLPPDTIEEIQRFFVAFLDLLTALKQQGIEVTRLELHQLLSDSLNNDVKAG